MHVRENYKAQLLSHIKRINGKIVLQLGNWDESVELKPEHTHQSESGFFAYMDNRHISGPVLRFCPPFPVPALPGSCHKPWPGWTSGLTGWTDQESLTLLAWLDFCYRGHTCTFTNWKDMWLYCVTLKYMTINLCTGRINYWREHLKKKKKAKHFALESFAAAPTPHVVQPLAHSCLQTAHWHQSGP